MTATNPIVEALRQQLQQLQAQRDSGAISAEAHAASRAEIERRIVDAVLRSSVDSSAAATSKAAATAPPRSSTTRWLTGFGLAGALLIGVAYWWFVQAEQVAEPAAEVATTPAPEAPHAMSQGDMVALTERLAERLKGMPDDAQGWVMLGRSYMVIGKPAQAVAAYERAIKLRPADERLMAAHAEAQAAAKAPR